jgi:hypothetical protein
MHIPYATDNARRIRSIPYNKPKFSQNAEINALITAVE